LREHIDCSRTVSSLGSSFGYAWVRDMVGSIDTGGILLIVLAVSLFHGQVLGTQDTEMRQ